MPDSYAPVLTVDIGAILTNYRLLRQTVAPAICGVAIKADAYGLGAAMIAPHLKRAGCEHFFVATVDEGIALRQFLPRIDQGGRIYLMNGLPPGSERDVAAHDLIPVLHSMGEIERWRGLERAPAPRPAGLQFDTGLNRLGLGSEEALRLIGDPHLLDGIEVGVVMSHLACADDPEHPLNRAQLARFREITGALKLPPSRHPGSRPLRSLAASSSIFLGGDFHFDLARPGAALYGISPILGAPNPLKPALRLQAKILQLREVDLNMTVGYGASHQVRGPSLLATIGIGYADGIFRSLGNRGAVFVAGQRAPIVGRISMDLMTIDVGHLPRTACQPGMAVDVIGPQQSIDDLARDAGTIGYEILTNLGARFQRRYSGA